MLLLMPTPGRGELQRGKTVEYLYSIYIIAILMLLLGASIFVHELGHYIAARWLGFVVEVFSIGFGPAMWHRKYNGIMYKIGWIPFGGYVALPQLDPTGMSLIQGTPEQGSEKTDKPVESSAPEKKYPVMAPWKRIVVSFAGAVGNIILAVIIAWIVYLVGMPAGPSERSAVVGYVVNGCKAYEQGLRTGDQILSVNGSPVKNWRSFAMEAGLHNEVTMKIKSASDGSEKVFTVQTEKGILGEQTLAGVRGLGLCNILSVSSGMSAEKAGLKGGDTILEFAGSPVYSMDHFVELVNEYKDQAMPIKVSRPVDGKLVICSMKVTPVYDSETKKVRIGITFNQAAVDLDTVVKPLPSEQLREHAALIFRFLKAIVTPAQAKAAASNVGGPVAIMISYWYIVKTSLMLAIWFTGLLNVNLAILNLLPIPVLDGGHMMFSLWEIVTRRPVSPKIVNALVNFFAALLLCFFVYITFKDFDRLTPARKVIKIVVDRMHGGNTAVTNASVNAVQPAGGVGAGSGK